MVAAERFGLWPQKLADKEALTQAEEAHVMSGREVAEFDLTRIKVFLVAALAARSLKVRSSSSFHQQASCRN